MLLSHTWARRPIPLSSTRHYHPEEVEAKRRRHTGPHWLTVEGTHIPLDSPDDMSLACRAVSAYHNYVAYNVPPDDGFAREVLVLEAKWQQHMEESSSDEEDGVYSDDDQVFDKEVYL
jgi:hypothetical protein